MEDPPIRNGPWLRRSRRVAYANPWITVWHDEVDRPDGKPGIYGVVHFENLAVGVVVIDDQDRLLLVGQHRYTFDAMSWEIPEGGVAPGEEALAGAKRELREETGVIAGDWRELGRLQLSDSVTDEAAILYTAQALALGEPDPEGTESIVVRWVPFEEALSMCLDGRIVDAMSVCAIERVALQRRSGRADDSGGH